MTNKQELAIQKLAENGGNIGKAMRDAGYSEISSKTPAKLTNSKAYKSKIKALAKANNVTIEQYVMNIGMAMQADKMNNFTGEITPDFGTRLAGNKQAERFLFKNKDESGSGITAEEIKELANTSDEVELSKLVFKRN